MDVPYPRSHIDIDKNGKIRRRVVGYRAVEARYWRDGGYAPSDIRYNLFYAYLLQSPSFLAVQAKLRGDACSLPMPKDWEKIEPIAHDFIDAHAELNFIDWWRKKGGLKLFSVRAPDPGVTAAVGRLSEKTRSLRLDWDGNDGVVIRVALNQSRKSAEKKMAKLFDRLKFDTPVRASVAPKYVFMKSGVRVATLESGVAALEDLLREGGKIPIWLIGNSLKLVLRKSFTYEEFARMKPDELAERKRLLAIAATRLIRTAALVAENAARGRFPCVDPFPEANLEFYRRKPGRPRKGDML